MILIADSGSTKCDWVLVKKDNNFLDRIRTKGINSSTQKNESIRKTISKCNELEKYKNKINEIYFFGAGCNTEKSKSKIEKILETHFINAKKISIHEDLMLAVLAVTTKPAIVCILGTGSNCCFFNGKNILQKNTAMGYLLMDEGSGNHLGKKLLRKYFYNKLPEDLKFSFEKSFNLNTEKVISKLYESKAPNKYLAKYARFLFENKEHFFSEQIINESINEFIDNQLSSYKEEIENVPIYFIGSIAYFAQDFINKNLNIRNINPPKSFVRRPLTQFVERIKKEDDFLLNI